MTSYHAQLLFEQSVEAIGQRNFARAETLLREVLALEPDMAEAHANLAWLLEQHSRVEGSDKALRREAFDHYQAAVQFQGNNIQIRLNFGAFLTRLRMLEHAKLQYLTALQLEPQSAGIWNNLGALLALMRRDDEAKNALDKAIGLNPSLESAHINLAFLNLRKGQLVEGWLQLEHRDWYHDIAARLPFERWQGDALQGKRMLVVFEAGQGDVIQFCRYVNLLKAQGASRVDMLCHPSLKRLLGTLQGVDAVIGFDEDLPQTKWDRWVPLLSLPFHFRTNLQNIPDEIPYLHAPEENRTLWRGKLPEKQSSQSLRVGLVWRGSTQFENDDQRSLPGLNTLSLLWKLPGLEFFSLQKGSGEDEVAKFANTQPLRALGHDLNDFADTAAVIEQLDLVISVDTAVAHLCGALGKPCFVLLAAYMTDWRWLEDHEDSPWYPHVMTLFRQNSQGRWDDVVANVRDALKQLLKTTSTPADQG